MRQMVMLFDDGLADVARPAVPQRGRVRGGGQQETRTHRQETIRAG
jgi:hypothetical protein